MRKGLLIMFLLLLLGGIAEAEVQVFFLPESGFLRVHGEVMMRPVSSTPSFLVFPTAQITELWADELVAYDVQRGSHGTVVTLTLRQARPQLFSFAYEGFLNLENIQGFLDRNSLWFPEFSFPIDSVEVKVELPEHWKLVSWQSEPPRYPAFTFQDGRGDQLAQVIPRAPVVDEFASRVQMQVSRLTTAINQRNATEIEALLGPALKETRLASYLASLPLSEGQITSEVRDQFTVIFATNRGLRYQASLLWQERAGRLELQSFQLRPQGAPIPPDLLRSTEDFTRQLRLAVQAGNRAQLLSFLDINIAQGQTQVAEFLLGLNATLPWSVEYAILDPFTITVLVPHADSTKFLLHLVLTPGDYNWLIQRLEVIPVG